MQLTDFKLVVLTLDVPSINEVGFLQSLLCCVIQHVMHDILFLFFSSGLHMTDKVWSELTEVRKGERHELSPVTNDPCTFLNGVNHAAFHVFQ